MISHSLGPSLGLEGPQSDYGGPESLNNIYLKDCGFLNGSGRLLVSLWGSQSINGPSMSVRSSGNLDGSQWVCGALCESAGPFENPDGSQLVCGALGVYAGPSMSIASSQSVCGPSVILRGLCKPLWLSVSMWASVCLWGIRERKWSQLVCRAHSNSVGPSTNLDGCQSVRPPSTWIALSWSVGS